MKKLIAMLLSIVLICSLLTGCGSDNMQKSSETGKTDTAVAVETPATLVIGQTGEIVNDLDIFGAGASGMYTGVANIVANVFSSLVRYDEVKGILPDLATEWTISEDGLEYMFTIRDNVKFHDGTELAISDFPFAFEEFKRALYAGEYVSNISSVEAAGDHQIKITLASADPLTLKKLAMVPILSESVMTEAGSAFWDTVLVGSGPYKFISWSSGGSMLLEGFEDYYAGPAPIAQIELRPFFDASAMVIALNNNEIQAISMLDPNSFGEIEGVPGYKLVLQDSSYKEFIAINCSTGNPALEDVRVRQAINYAIDTKSILLAQQNDVGELVKNYCLSPYALGYSENEDVAAYPYDPEKAKALLADAGYGDGLSLNFTASAGWGDIGCQIAAENLRQIGIDVNFEVVDPTIWGDRYYSGDYDLCFSGEADMYLDPDFLSLSYGTGGGYNQYFYSDPDVDKLLEQAHMETDDKTREDLYHQAIAIIREAAPVVPLYYTAYGNACVENLQGYEPGIGVVYNYFYDIYYDLPSQQEK